MIAITMNLYNDSQAIAITVFHTHRYAYSEKATIHGIYSYDHITIDPIQAWKEISKISQDGKYLKVSPSGYFPSSKEANSSNGS